MLNIIRQKTVPLFFYILSWWLQPCPTVMLLVSNRSFFHLIYFSLFCFIILFYVYIIYYFSYLCCIYLSLKFPLLAVSYFWLKEKINHLFLLTCVSKIEYSSHALPHLQPLNTWALVFKLFNCDFERRSGYLNNSN